MTKQTDQPLSIEEAIKIVEKIIAFSIDDSVKEEERYTREHLFSLSLASLDWIYLTKVKNRKVKEDYAATSNIIKSVSEAYDCKKHTTQLEDAKITTTILSDEKDKARALLKTYILKGKVNIVSYDLLHPLCTLALSKDKSEYELNKIKERINELYQKEVLLTQIEKYISKAEKIIGYNLENNQSVEDWRIAHHDILLSWFVLKEQSLGVRDEDYHFLSEYVKNINDGYDSQKHNTRLEELEFVVDEHSTEIDKGRALVQKFVMEGHTKFAREVSNNIYILLSESENIIQDEVGRRIQEKYIKDKKENINKHYQEEFGK
jgi:hypothetical protein